MNRASKGKRRTLDLTGKLILTYTDLVLGTADREQAVFGAISHPARRRMVDLLLEADRSVNTIAGHFLQMSRPAVSQHLFSMERDWMMSSATKRSILRWIHIVFAIPIVGYVYSPFEDIPDYAPIVRFIAVPVIVFTGLWMWQGHVLRRLFSKRSVQPGAT
jgi:DNA-binding transcriptional ArsR family regulator